MLITRQKIFFVIACLLGAIAPLFLLPTHAAAKKLVVGVTLHSYYSWVANIAGDTVTLSTIIPKDSDPHNYQVRPQDLANLQDLDCIVVNTLGHDDYIEPMLKAAGKEGITKIKPNKGLPLIKDVHKKFSFQKDSQEQVSYNSHTYISIIGTIQQINTIADGLGKLNPQFAKLYHKNARAYGKKLRGMLANALEKLDKQKADKLTIATVHDGYAYLFQELGITVDAVVQPRHGIEPSARQLADTINRIKKSKVNVLFTEVDYKKKYVETIFEETHCRIYKLSHVSSGSYNTDTFVNDMQYNLDTILSAISEQ